MPTGLVVWRGAAAIPAGWLLCDGAAVSRTTFAALFTAIGTTYGAGNGSTTFNVPQLTDSRYAFGANGGSIARGTTGGTLDHDHAAASHTHTVVEPGNHALHDAAGGHAHDAHTMNPLVGGSGTNTLTGPDSHGFASSHTHDEHSAHTGSGTNSGGSTLGTSEPPFLALVPIIKT